MDRSRTLEQALAGLQGFDPAHQRQSGQRMTAEFGGGLGVRRHGVDLARSLMVRQ